MGTSNFLEYILAISVILGHPDKSSFNHAIASTVVSTLRELSYQVNFHDLYQEGFDPILPAQDLDRDVALPYDIKKHCDQIASAEGIVIIHPNWWGQPPAILKGWIDRVIRPGVAYEFLGGINGEGVPHGLLKAKTGLVFTTSNTYLKRELEVFGDPLETIWKYCILGLCGVKEFYRRQFGVVVTSTLDQRERWLEETVDIVTRNFSRQVEIEDNDTDSLGEPI